MKKDLTPATIPPPCRLLDLLRQSVLLQEAIRFKVASSTMANIASGPGHGTGIGVDNEMGMLRGNQPVHPIFRNLATQVGADGTCGTAGNLLMGPVVLWGVCGAGACSSGHVVWGMNQGIDHFRTGIEDATEGASHTQALIVSPSPPAGHRSVPHWPRGRRGGRHRPAGPGHIPQPGSEADGQRRGGPRLWR